MIELTMESAAHWNRVYTTKGPLDFSWHQAVPRLSLALIDDLGAEGAVLDVGGGASVLVDYLLERPFARVSVVDISSAALTQAKERLGPRADRVSWIVADVAAMPDLGTVDLWHDRAVFHFLIDADDRQRYAALVRKTVRLGGHAVIATFASDGPERCSDLPVCRYDVPGLASELGEGFELVRSEREVHVTPWNKPQSFIYVVLRRAGIVEGN